jgi:hypothetical protein
MKNPSLLQIKDAIRNKYTWPGGYPMFFIMIDGEALSIDSARECWYQICSAMIHNNDKQWQIGAIDINYEDPSLYCIHSNKRIESAYAEDEALENQEMNYSS